MVGVQRGFHGIAEVCIVNMLIINKQLIRVWESLLFVCEIGIAFGAFFSYALLHVKNDAERLF